MTIGAFDGLHIGHRFLIAQLKERAQSYGAQSVLLTFKTHPQVFFNPEGDFKVLTTNEEKIEHLNMLGIDALVFMDFDHSIATLQYCDFVKQILVQKLNAKAIIMGYDHHFGKGGEGTYSLVKSCAQEVGVDVFQVAEHNLGEHLSSSQIRKALFAGDVERANRFLGYNYGFTAMVVKGRQIGRTLGFPTANFSLLQCRKLMPAIGVYVVRVYVDGTPHFGILNYGVKPTVDSVYVQSAEVFIFDFSADIYGKQLRVEFLAHIRNEQKFNSLDALRSQIMDDKKIAEDIIEQRKF